MNRFFLLILLLILTGCGTRSNENVLTEFPNDGTGMPRPQFDKPFTELQVSLRETFDAEKLEISRPYNFAGQPYNYDSIDLPDYWLKVTLLNPEIPRDVQGDPFTVFAENVAVNTYRHLTNSDEFIRIEICVKQKGGRVILRFDSEMSKFLWRDSINVAEEHHN